jgi:hypothetical protein
MMRSIFFTLASLYLSCILASPAQRSKRFLNSKVANRLTVLEQSHTEHREDTSITRNIFFGTVTSLLFILLVIIITIVFLCRRLRRIVRDRQAPTLAAVEASGLPYIHPTMNALFQTLQRLNNIEQHHRDPLSHHFSPQLAPTSGMNFNSVPSNVLKY